MNKNEYQHYYISSANTYVVATGTCKLGGILVGETAAGAITVKDGSSVIAVLKSGIAEGTYWLPVNIGDNLSIITAAGSKITVFWAK